MTWSIFARDEETGALGVAAATRFFAVGARVPFVAPGVAAIATQALVNPYYGIDGLQLARQGRAPVEVLAMLTSQDPGSAHRQVHIVDSLGRPAAHTGELCLEWSGHRIEDNVSVAGNMLASERVVSEALENYRAGARLPFPRRLISAMRAGEAAGGDRRGKQSACLIIFAADEWSLLD